MLAIGLNYTVFLPTSLECIFFFSARFSNVHFFFRQYPSLILGLASPVSGRSGAEFANFTYLESLSIKFDSFTDWEIELVPELFGLPHLTTIDLENVIIVSPIPPSFSTSSLERASITGCEMGGMLPETLPVNLTELNLMDNNLEGGIPLSW